jgi:hypothetical protein
MAHCFVTQVVQHPKGTIATANPTLRLIVRAKADGYPN